MMIELAEVIFGEGVSIFQGEDDMLDVWFGQVTISISNDELWYLHGLIN